MRKRLTFILLALVLCFTGAMFAVGCKKDPVIYTVTYYAENGVDVLATKEVEEGQATAPVTEGVTEKAGYTVVWNDADGNAYDFTSAVNGNLALYLGYTANTDVAYKVEHYVEKVTGGYENQPTEVEEGLTGTTDTTVTATPKTFEGCALDASNKKAVASATLAGDGSTVLKLYYARNEYTVKFMNGTKQVDDKDVLHGAAVDATKKVVADQNKTLTTIDVFSHWSATENGEAYDFNTAVTGNLTLYAVFNTESREYDVTVNTTGAEGYWTLTDKDGAPLSEATVTAGQAFEFKLDLGVEAAGNPVVTAVIGNDIEETEETVTLTAVDGVYSVEVTGETEISVKVDAVLYDATVSYEIAFDVYDKEWAAPSLNFTDFKLIAEDTVSGEATETVPSADTYGSIKFSVKAGTYNLYIVKVFGEEQYAVSNELTYTISNALNNAEGNAVEGNLTVRPVAFSEFNNAEYNDNNEISSVDNTTFSAVLAGFAPGEADFAFTVSYDQVVNSVYEANTEINEFTPTIGADFGNAEHSVGLWAIAEGNGRVNVDEAWDWEGGMTKDVKYLMTGAGALFGFNQWPDCYRHAEFTYVKTGGWMYVSVTADGDAGYINGEGNLVTPTSAIKYEDLLLYVVDIENGVVYFKQSVVSGVYEKFENELITDALTNIEYVGFRMQTGDNKPIDVNAHGYGYTMDAEVIAAYAEKFAEAKARYVENSNNEERITWTNVNGNSLHVRDDDSLQHVMMSGSTQDMAIRDKYFVPSAQKLEFQWTMSNVTDQDNWPMLGFFVKDTVTGGYMRFAWVSAGDQVLMTTKEDYQGRLFMTNANPWEWFGNNCVLKDAGGNKIAGDTYYTWQPSKYYHDSFELTVKVVLDGYKLSVYCQTSLTKEYDPNAWATIDENFDVYERYDTATGGFQNNTVEAYLSKINDATGNEQWKDDFYSVDNSCQFGITARMDMRGDMVNNRPIFSNVSYTITDK